MQSNSARILIVDDNEDMRYLLSQLVQQEGMEAIGAQDGETALHMIRCQSPNVVLLDMRMPGLNGYQVLKQIKEWDSDLPLIIITAFGSIQDAVQMIKEGAYDYLSKPFEHDEVILTIRRALKENHLKRKLRGLTSSMEGQPSLQEVMGGSERIRQLAAEVACVAPTPFSVVILGETGTGKEVVAHAIHQQSGRPAAKLVAVDCGAIPETLMESELFGYEKGAFTGATRAQAGKFELAATGTLFLDEISNLPVSMQSKLLRVLQEKRFYRVGGTRPIAADVRIITATNQPFDSGNGTVPFRRDLYHRISEYVILVPPLRERREDIIFLAKRFLNLTNEELQKNVRGFSESTLDLLLTYDWPGNVRELRNYIRRGVLLAEEIIKPEHLNPFTFKAAGDKLNTGMHPEGLIKPEEIGTSSLKEILGGHTIAVEKEVIHQTLKRTGGNKAKAARMLQIDYKTIHTKMKKYGISPNGGGYGRQG